MTDKLRASTRERLNYWLLLLRKPGQWMEFDAAELGISRKTLLNYIEVENMRTGGRYKVSAIKGDRIGVRRVHAGGDA